MILDSIYVLVGLVVLLWSADRFIDGAAGTANHFGMSPLLIGMLVVGFGTSAPEMVVSAFAAYDGNSGLALGNAYGSNIGNIGLVLGITALFYPISVSSRIVHREIPLFLLTLVLSFVFFYNGILGRIESATLLLAMVVILMIMTFYGDKKDSLIKEINNEDIVPKTSLKTSMGQLAVGLALLLVSSHYLVKGAVGIAEYFGVSDLIIGLTVVAVGTSLPELASTIAAAKKGESDIALGNIVGSCLINALSVVGIAGVIHPMIISPIFLQRDFAVSVALTILLWIFSLSVRKAAVIDKKKGGILFLGYFAYTVYLLMTLNA